MKPVVLEDVSKTQAKTVASAWDFKQGFALDSFDASNEGRTAVKVGWLRALLHPSDPKVNFG